MASSGRKVAWELVFGIYQVTGFLITTVVTFTPPFSRLKHPLLLVPVRNSLDGTNNTSKPWAGARHSCLSGNTGSSTINRNTWSAAWSATDHESTSLVASARTSVSPTNGNPRYKRSWTVLSSTRASKPRTTECCSYASGTCKTTATTTKAGGRRAWTRRFGISCWGRYNYC